MVDGNAWPHGSEERLPPVTIHHLTTGNIHTPNFLGSQEDEFRVNADTQREQGHAPTSSLSDPAWGHFSSEIKLRGCCFFIQ